MRVRHHRLHSSVITDDACYGVLGNYNNLGRGQAPSPDPISWPAPLPIPPTAMGRSLRSVVSVVTSVIPSLWRLVFDMCPQTLILKHKPKDKSIFSSANWLPWRNLLLSVRRTYSQIYYLQFGIICTVVFVWLWHRSGRGWGLGRGLAPSPVNPN